MRRNSTEISRRALLGGVCAGPLLGAVEGPVPGVGGGSWPHLCLTFGAADCGPPGAAAAAAGEEAGWGRALACFRRAEAALAALAHSEDEDRYDRQGARHDCALVRLLLTPAPHLAALADKLDLLIAHQAWELTAGDACLRSLSEDLRRLAG